MASPVPRPQELVARARRELRHAADPVVADRRRRTLAHPVRCLGVSDEALRELAAGYVRISADHEIDDTLAFTGALLTRVTLEEKHLGLLVAAGRAEHLAPRHLRRLLGWAAAYTGNRTTLDLLARTLLAPLMIRFPAEVRALPRWAASPNPWVRRAAAVTLIEPVRREQHVEVAYEVAHCLAGDRSPVVAGAVGWLLQVAGEVDDERLGVFLGEEGRRHAVFTVRQAVEHLPESRREAILDAVRPPRSLTGSAGGAAR